MTERISSFPDKKRAAVDYKRVTETLKETHDIYKEADVGQEKATWLVNGEYPKLPITFTWMSDIHYGHVGVDYDRLNHHLQIVEDTPNMFVIFGGDDTDNYAIKHSHAGIMGDAVSPQMQIEAWMDKVQHLDRMGKVGAMTHGNHNDWINYVGLDFYRTFWSEVQAPVFTKGGVLNITVNGGQLYRAAISHQFWGRSKLNPENSPRRLMDYGHEGGEHLDIALVGHDHQAAGSMYDRGGKDKIVVDGGTYKLSEMWGEQRWGPAGKGGYTIMLWPNEKRMELFRDPVVAQQMVLGLIWGEENGEKT